MNRYFEHIYIYIHENMKNLHQVNGGTHGQVPQETKISPEDLAQWASTPEAMLLGDDGRKWPWSISISV